MRERTILKGYVLTPVHVGSGEEFRSDCYRLHGNMLERFDPAAVLAAMPETEQESYISALNKGEIVRAQQLLRNGAGGADIREKMEVSSQSRDEIDRSLKGGTSGGEIWPMTRSGGHVILPGSSVKGALRTAWLAHCLANHAGEAQRLARSLSRPAQTDNEYKQLVRTAFAMDQGASPTQQDPLRDLAVSDAIVETPGRIDRGGNAARKENGLEVGSASKIQMHVERLASVSDGVSCLVPFDIGLHLPAPAVMAKRGRIGEQATNRQFPLQGISISYADLRKAVNAFHADIWLSEIQHFYKDSPTAALLTAVLGLFDIKAGNLGPSLDARGAWLLRIGRFGHFESKSVPLDGRRFGVKAKRKDNPARFMDHGGTRTVTKDEHERLVPFGWVLLLPEQGAPVPAPKLDKARLPRPSGTSVSGQAADPMPGSGAGFRFRKGDRVTNGDEDAMVVEDVPLLEQKMALDFGDGDTPEEVSVEGWKKI